MKKLVLIAGFYLTGTRQYVKGKLGVASGKPASIGGMTDLIDEIGEKGKMEGK
jgi:hypothetical protein